MATTLTPDAMKRFVKDHFDEFVNNRNAAVIRQNMTAHFLDHDGPGGKPTDIEGDEQMMLSMYKSMPDLRVAVEEMIADTSSGRKMEFHGFVLWRFEGEKIAERWATVTPPAEEGSGTWISVRSD